MVAVTVLGIIGMLVSMFGGLGMFGCGELLEKMVHPMGRGRSQK